MKQPTDTLPFKQHLSSDKMSVNCLH